MVRSVLSGYTGEPPDRLTFVKGAFGKPSLAANGCGEKIEFNVSHSENLMVVAVSSIGCVGIDVEYLGGNAAWERVVPSAFTEREIAAVSSLPLPEQSAGYYQCWVLKEAYVKATGLGLTLPLRDVEVYMYCTEGRLRFSLAAAGAWWSQEVDVADDYVCALVVDGSPRRVRCGLVPDHEWPGTKMCSVQPGSAIHPA
jgi:4'-phosphopantetheinyl transferase